MRRVHIQPASLHRRHVRYAYTGVPWAAPLVTGMVGGGDVSLDGGSTVVFSGVGFAPSPFLKCALAQTDPNKGHDGGGVFGTDPAPPALGEYHHYYRGGTAGNMRKLTAPYTFANEPRVALGRGTVVFGAAASTGGGVGTSGLPLAETNDWTGLSDPRHRAQSVALAAAWNAGAAETRQGKVPPFWQEPNDVRRLGRDVGFFEVMECVAPAAPAAMAGYYLGGVVQVERTRLT